MKSSESLLTNKVQHKFPLQNPKLKETIESYKLKFSRKYQCQAQHYYIELMNYILDPQKEKQAKQQLLSPTLRIDVHQAKVNDDQEHMAGYYQQYESAAEIASLCEYYKYYLQEPPHLHKQNFDIMYRHSQKKKEILYRKLQKLLNLSDVSLTQNSTKKEHQNTKIDEANTNLTNILDDLQISRQSMSSKDQSRCIISLRDKLIKTYGDTSILNIKDIDKHYNFQKIHHMPSTKSKKVNIIIPFKKSQKITEKDKKKKTFLESTNSSNSNIQTHAQTHAATPMGYSQANISKYLHKKLKCKVSQLKQVQNFSIKDQIGGASKTSCQNTLRKLVEPLERKLSKKKHLKRKSCDFTTNQKFKLQINDEKQFQQNNLANCVGTQNQEKMNIINIQYKQKNKNNRKSQQIKYQISSPQKQKLFLNNSIRRSLDNVISRDIKKSRHLKFVTQGSNNCDVKKTIQNCRSKIRQQISQFDKQINPYSMNLTKKSIATPLKQIFFDCRQIFKKKKTNFSSHTNLKTKKCTVQKK